MKFNILVIPDIHWGAIHPNDTVKGLQYIPVFIEECFNNNIRIDLIVIAGDYFDSKLPLNSRDAILAIQWFHDLYDLAIRCGVSKIRMMQGTLDHDNDQLEVFEPLVQQNSDFFRIFYNTTLEETLDGLSCIYCPDETVYTSEYEEMYVNEMCSMKDIGFFHGSFDVVYGSLLESRPDILEKKNVMFRYGLWNKSFYGPMISGHWHDGKIYDDLIYVGSPYRYKFNEEEPKGIGFITYDNESHVYSYQKILNPLCADYVTYEIYSNIYQTKEDYKMISDEIDTIIKDFRRDSFVENKLRIKIYIVDDKPENDVFISSLRQKIINDKNIKITIKNKLKDKKKKETMQLNIDRQKRYSFIQDKEKEPYEKIHDFIMTNNPDANIPIDFVKEQVQKYMIGKG